MKSFLLKLAAFIVLVGFPSISAAQYTAAELCQAGNTVYSQKKYDMAIQYYEACLDVDSRFWQAYQGLGNCYYAKGDNAKALTNYQRSLSLHQDNPGLSTFTNSLRTQTDASNKTNTPAHFTGEDKKILTASSETSVEHFELAPCLGIAGCELGTGIGLGASGYYMFDSLFGIGGITRLYLFGSDFYGSTNSLEIVPAIKLKLDDKTINPYLVGGFGLTLVSAGNDNGIFPIFDAGIGLEYSLDDKMSLFLEGRVDTIFGQYSSVTYVPLEAGLNFKM
jgi:tetratricopeptide (TPR) repeat protein